VADSGKHRIQKFDANGDYISQWDGDIAPITPEKITVDVNGYFYVYETTGHCIYKFDLSENYNTKWGNYGSDDGEFEVVKGIRVDNQGNIYAADWSQGRI
jgi:hypothetical protein